VTDGQPGAGAELSRAAAMIELSRFEDAARLLAGIVASEPGRARAWALLSRAQLGAGRPGEALAAAQRAIAADPDDHWPFRLASTALVSLGRGQEALAAALEARRLAPAVWRSHVCLSQAALAAGDYGLAGVAAAQALALAPEEPDVQFTAGKAALSEGDLRRAREHQQAALAIDPEHSAAINELGRISLREQDIGGAAGYFMRAARAAPGIGIFGRNTEIALAKVLTNITVVAATVAAAGIVLPFAGRVWPVIYLVAMVMLAGLGLSYAVYQVRGLPADGRRHLRRMLRRRHWLLTVAAIVGVIDGLAAAAAAVLAVGYRAGSSSLEPVVIAAVALGVARPVVTLVIRTSRRAIR
jgi:tetratricopeptide (TPR) repeat protein